MSNSPLVNYVRYSPNHSSRKGVKITKITPHHMSGNLSVETCASVFSTKARQASSNYGIGSDGRIGLYVPESERAWTSSNAANDRSAVTIEVANSVCGGEWPVSQKAWDALVKLCVDICKRNGIPKLVWTGGPDGTLTVHRMFANTDCPGPYLLKRMPELAAQVNARLSGKPAPSAPAPAPQPAKPANPASDELAVDGSWGINTTKRGQQLAGTMADGRISNQPSVNAKYVPSAVAGVWQWKQSGYAQGSAFIKAVQKRLGITADGFCGPNTTHAMQYRLKELGFYSGALDRYFGPESCKALQRMFNLKRFF